MLRIQAGCIISIVVPFHHIDPNQDTGCQFQQYLVRVSVVLMSVVYTSLQHRNKIEVLYVVQSPRSDRMVKGHHGSIRSKKRNLPSIIARGRLLCPTMDTTMGPGMMIEGNYCACYRWRIYEQYLVRLLGIGVIDLCVALPRCFGHFAIITLDLIIREVLEPV